MKALTNQLLASIVCLLPMWAETTIRDTIRTPIAGGLFNGEVVISSPDLTWQGQTYRRHNTTVLVTNGALYLRLIPTIADPDGLSSRVQYMPRGGSGGWVEFWVVPDTTSELKIYQVNRASQPSTGVSVGLHQIAGARGNSGRALCSDGTIWSSCDLLVNPAFTPGDILFRGTAGLEALNIGLTAGHVLTVQAGRPAWTTLAASQVTQHQAALAIAWGQLTGLPSTFTPSAHAHAATEITSGLLALARLPSLPASQVTSGTFADARIAASSVVQHQAALAIGWGQLSAVPAIEVPLSFSGGLVRTGNSVICTTCGGGSSGSGLYTKSFSASTSVAIPFSDHAIPNDRLIVDCYDAAGARLEADTVYVDPTTYEISVAFSPAQTGNCTVTGQAFIGRTFSQGFSGTSAVIPNVSQEIGTPLFSWRVYGADGYLIEPDSTSLDAGGNFTVYVAPSISGRVVIVGR